MRYQSSVSIPHNRRRVVAVLRLIAASLAIALTAVGPSKAICVCRLDPVANFGTFFVYLAEERATCTSPSGEGECSPPVLFLLVDAPGLPGQNCPDGECEELAGATSAAEANDDWTIPEPYPTDFSLHSISNSNPAYFAVFPSGERPAKAVRQDFTLFGPRGSKPIHVRTFKAERTLRLAGPGGKTIAKPYVYAVGAEFKDDDTSDNIIVGDDANRPGAAGKTTCRVFQHQYAGDTEPTEHMVLICKEDAK